jgi:murein DD-endopeptidase MepM/ murein hydrolase activator NlpD
MQYEVCTNVNLRKMPGYINVGDGSYLGVVPKGTQVSILGEPRYKDGLHWGLIRGGAHGWIALKLPNGQNTVAPKDMRTLARPLAPSMGRVTQTFTGNCKWYCGFVVQGAPLRGHNGIDYGVPENSPVLAVDDGLVIRAAFDSGGYGHFIRLSHAWGESIYAHLNEYKVSQGQTVHMGRVIGLSGNTGNSTGPHLHFAIRVRPVHKDDGWGGYCDPMPFLT